MGVSPLRRMKDQPLRGFFLFSFLNPGLGRFIPPDIARRRAVTRLEAGRSIVVGSFSHGLWRAFMAPGPAEKRIGKRIGGP